MDLVTSNSTSKPRHLPLPPIYQLNLVHHLHRPGQYTMDYQRSGEGMEDCEIDGWGSSHAVFGRGLFRPRTSGARVVGE